jgi:rhodanese-related sulfurtransferase
MAAFAAQNDLSGYAPLISADAAWAAFKAGSATLLDLRTNGDRRKLPVDGAAHIPLDELDWRLDEVPSGPLLLLSRAGYESHIALRKLVQAGRSELKNVSGGALSLALAPGFTPGE